MLWRLMAQESPFQCVTIIPIPKIVYASIIALLSSPRKSPWLHCLYYKHTKTGKAGRVGTTQELKGREEVAEHQNSIWRIHIDIQSPCQCLEANTAAERLTRSIALKTETAPPEWKLLLGVRCCCNTKKDTKKGNLKMWFSFGGLQYSKMLLFLLSVPFMCSESGLPTWLTRN